MSYNREYKIIIIFLILLNETQFTGAPAKTSAISDAQKKEVEKLRAQLNEALEKDETSSPAAVVQPKWLNSNKTEASVNAKVVVTQTVLDEVKALRASILKAVATHSFAANVSNDNDDKVAQLTKEFREKTHAKEVLRETANTDEQYADSDYVVGATTTTEHDDSDPTLPNIVQASTVTPDIDVRKLQRVELAKRRTKEELILNSIIEDYNFDLGDGVEEWEHIVHNGQEYFIGRRKTDLLIVEKEKAGYEPGKVLTVDQPISYLETYSFWNHELQQQEGVILVATADKVLWYRVSQKTGDIELYWEWLVGTPVTGLTYFTVVSNKYVVVSSNQSLRTGLYALNIYQFNLQTLEFWIAQRLQLQHPCGEVTILDTGHDLILATSQNNTAAIYSFNPHADGSNHIRFGLHKTINSEGVKKIGGFQMGGRSYLALSGLQPQILLYQQGEFIPKTILGNNFGLVELFFPIPARTYRDDLILLVQHRVDFSTHTITALDALIWDGAAFQATIPAPCHMGEQTVYGINCLLDIERDEGIKGAAILRRGNEISIIVPRRNTESGLFRLNIELLPRNSELLDLEDIFAFLKNWVKEEDDLIAKAQEFLDTPIDIAAGQMQPDFSAVEELETPELNVDNGNVGEIHINDYVWTDDDSNVNLVFLVEKIEQLSQELLYKREKREVEEELAFDKLDFDEVEAEELIINSLNNEEFYIQDGVLNFDGVLHLQELEVLEEANVRTRRQAFDKSLEIDGNLEFAEINGIPWADIRDNLVFRNLPIELENLDVNGEVVIEEEVSVNFLNTLNFPNDYLWSSGSVASVVTAEKTFTGTLVANSVDSNGLINGVNPLDAITLSDPQDWTGLPTFAQLEITEKLELNGTVQTDDLVDLPNNPTLLESRLITAACNFEHLEVHGPIHINGTFDNVDLEQLLADIVQLPVDPAQEIKIASNKTFSTVAFPVDFHVRDNAVSGIAIDKFVTLNTEQQLNLTALKGYVYFNNLTVSGKFDGVDIAKMVEESIKTDEPQFSTNTQLNFVRPITANFVNVRESFNGAPLAEGFQMLNEDLVLPEANFEELHAKVADIPNGILGAAQLNNLNLNAFLEKRNWQAPTDSGNIYVNELELERGLETDELNGIDAKLVMNFLDEIDELPEMILDGKIQVDQVIVTGDVQINKLDGQHFDEDIQLTAIWLNRPNYLSTNLEFAENLAFMQDLVVLGDYNGDNLPALVDDMLLRSDNATSLILATKSFEQNVHVRGTLKLDAINGVPFTEIANKRTNTNFKGTLRINGNVIAKELELTGSWNEHDISSLSSKVRYDQHLQTFVLLGETHLPAAMSLDDLSVYGNLNEVTDVKTLFEQLVYKNDDCLLKGQYNFTGRVTIEGGAYVRHLNGLNLIALLNNIIYVRDTAPALIMSPINFKAPVVATEIIVNGALTTANLTGCAIDEWLNETLRIDRPQTIPRYLLFAAGSLDGNSLYARYWNDVDLSELITLHTEQNLTHNLLFNALYLDGEIHVNGPINDVDLQSEYANTLMTHGNQHVSTPLTMSNVRVLQNLRTNAPVNSDKDLRKLAKLHGDLELESPLYFENVQVDNVNTNDQVSGIDLEQWFNDTLWLSGQSEQNISGNWTVQELSVLSEPVWPSASTDGEVSDEPNEVYTIFNYMRFTRTNKDQLLGQALANHSSGAQNHSYALQQLTEGFELNLNVNTSIRKVFVLDQLNLLINVDCQTLIYKWHTADGRYEHCCNFESGPIEQIFSLENAPNSTSLKFITNAADNANSNCTFKGLNIWHLNRTQVQHLRILKLNITALQVLYTVPPKLYVIADNAVNELALAHDNHTFVCDLPVVAPNASYHFLPHATQAELLVSDGYNLILFTNLTTSRNKRAPYVPQKYHLPLHYQRAVKYIRAPTESILKPNATVARKLAFADFKPIIENILTDLVYRLSLEVNITQLSIPESDLYDEHLVEDFIAIMEELQKQEIYPAELFEDIDWAKLEIPGNPAQVLAARTVQIIWPVIIEIEEVHDYLRDNTTNAQGECACITASLGLMVRDVLLLANAKGGFNELNNTASDYVEDLSAVIKRIREFEADVEVLAKRLNAETKAELANEGAERVQAENGSLTAENNARLKVLKTAIANHTYSELLPLQVGAEGAPRTLLAVISARAAKLPLVAGQQVGIEIYTDTLNGQLFQTIATAHRPRALTAIRIRAETLLAFAVGCCTVHVHIYRGVQGFVEYAQFKTDARVVQLLSLALPLPANGAAYFLAAVFERKVVFYQFQIAGIV